MPTLQNGKVTYQGGEQLPTLGSAEYNQAAAGNLPPVNPVTPLNGSSIGNVQPLNIPTPQPTTASGNLGVVSGVANSAPNGSVSVTRYVDNPDGTTTNYLSDGTKSTVRYTKNADGTLTPVEVGGSNGLVDGSHITNPILQKINELMGVQATEGDKTAQYRKDQGIDEKTQALNDITNRATTTARMYEDQKRKILKNETGLFGGAVEQNANILQRQGDQHLADIAIEKSVAQGDLTTAQNIVDAKIKAEFEPIDNQIKALTSFYTLNQNDLSESQSLALQEKIADRAAERDYQYAVRLAQAKQDLDAKVAGGTAILPGTHPGGKPDYVTAGFANRAKEASDILVPLESDHKTLLSSGLGYFRKSPNALKPVALQKYEQAQENFLRAVLRKESGAAISQEEIDNGKKQYFAVPGDSKEVILQKQRNRIDSLNGLIGGAGKAYGGIYQEKPNTYLNATFDKSADTYLNNSIPALEGDGYSAYLNTL